MDDNIKRAQRTLGSMGWRAMTNKLILIFIMLVLVAGIVGVILIKWGKYIAELFPSPTPTPTPTPTPNGTLWYM